MSFLQFSRPTLLDDAFWQRNLKVDPNLGCKIFEKARQKVYYSNFSQYEFGVNSELWYGRHSVENIGKIMHKLDTVLSLGESAVSEGKLESDELSFSLDISLAFPRSLWPQTLFNVQYTIYM